MRQIRQVIDEHKARLFLNAAGGAFSGYPYLVTQIVPTLIHIIVLPNKEINWLTDVACKQVCWNELPVCLVLGDQNCLYLEKGAQTLRSRVLPFGRVVYGKLKPVEAFEREPELVQRERALLLYEKSQPQSGYLSGDLGRGGRKATALEIKILSGLSRAGHPKGLANCCTCGQLRGQCLDPADTGADWIVPVHCSCENQNFCAACGQKLYSRRLNGNYFEPADKHVWHVPGFCGLSHECFEN